ncbi:MAG: hypothetical protein NVS9B8_02990 [Candidatus Limnocylindrales bacterium]
MSRPYGSRNDRWFVIAAAAAFVTLLVLGSATTFRVDDWDLVANRSLGDFGSLLTPFNQQFIAVPAGIFRLIFAVVGLHSYLTYLAVLLAIHVVTAVVVRRLVAELAGPSLGQAAGIVVLFLGAGYENLNAAFQIGQVTATVTGLLAIEAVGLRRRPRLAAGLLVVSLASHAVGAAYLVGAVVAALAVDRRSLRWMALPVFVIAAWALAFDLRQLASRDEPLAAALAAVPAFMVVGPLAATGAVFGLGSAGGAPLVALAAIAATVSRSRPASAPLVAATGAAILTEFALIAVSRSSYGIGATGWSRYLYSAVPLVLVFAAAWVGSATRIHDEPHRRRAGLVLGALTLVAVSGTCASTCRLAISRMSMSSGFGLLRRLPLGRHWRVR